MPGNPKTQFATNDSLTRKKWARDLFRYILPSLEYNYLVGTGADAVVQMRTELAKGEGDQITFGIRKPLTGTGVVGRGTVEGNEEALKFTYFQVTVEELNHAVDTGGRMDEQRIPYNLMQEGKDALQEWWSDILSDVVINTLVGNTTFTIAGETFAQACTTPDVGHHMAVNQADGTAVATAETAITAADQLDLTFLDRMKQRAEVPYGATPPYYKIRPLRLSNKNYYRVIMHPYVFDALRQNTNVGQWGDLRREAGQLGMPEVEISYNGMLLTKSERIPKMSTVGSGGVYRTVLVGAQSACFAWGGAGESKSTTMAFVPYEKDAKRYVMIRGGGIFGCKKTVFDGVDFGVITGSSYAEKLS